MRKHTHPLSTHSSKSVHTHTHTTDTAHFVKYSLRDKEEQELFKSQQSDGRVELIYFNLLQQLDTTNLVFTGQKSRKKKERKNKKTLKSQKEKCIKADAKQKADISFTLFKVCFKLSALYRSNNNNNKKERKTKKNLEFLASVLQAVQNSGRTKTTGRSEKGACMFTLA